MTATEPFAEGVCAELGWRDGEVASRGMVGILRSAAPVKAGLGRRAHRVALVEWFLGER